VGSCPHPASARFRFRFIVRGERANALVVLAVKSLKRCHPNVGILLVDANDTPSVEAHETHLVDAVVHVRPDDDELARAVGRGSPRHLFYWRHSPQVLSALPRTDRYDVYADGDLIFLRPMNLASLLGPLARGRIAAAVDESSLYYYGRLATLASAPAAALLPSAGAGGPLLQAGLLFTNPADDGGFYDRFWEFAVRAARSGDLPDLPWDDMCIVSTLLGEGGPLWERLLPLGYEWNYITDVRKDPGVFGCAAHYGGQKAKTFILSQVERLFSSGADPRVATSWGTVSIGNSAEDATLMRGAWPRPEDLDHACRAEGARGLPPVSVPFCLSWAVPRCASRADVCASLCARASSDAAAEREATFFVYVDGQLAVRLPTGNGRVQAAVRFAQAETVTIIAVSRSLDSHVHLEEPFTAAPRRSECGPAVCSICRRSGPSDRLPAFDPAHSPPSDPSRAAGSPQADPQ
jgi:hypothetical protein